MKELKKSGASKKQAEAKQKTQQKQKNKTKKDADDGESKVWILLTLVRLFYCTGQYSGGHLYSGGHSHDQFNKSRKVLSVFIITLINYYTSLPHCSKKCLFSDSGLLP